LVLNPILNTLVFGLGIVSAAFLISWACEAVQKDISKALAIAFVALIAVLPEYTVDVILAWKAGADPTGPYIHYAAANMTGANRLLVGLGWPLVFFLYWAKTKKSLIFEKSISMELIPLTIATLLSFLIFLQGGIEIWHSVVLIGIFILYIWMISHSEIEEPDLLGPAQSIGLLKKNFRISIIAFLFIFSASVILSSAEPFVESLLDTGESLGVDKFILIQWVAPLASEAPELLIASLLAFRGHALWAMIVLISSKVNHWSLLVASLPITYSISYGVPSPLPLDARQLEEFLLTSAQSLFAIILLIRLRLNLIGSITLFLLFITQLFFTEPNARYVYVFIYLALSLFLLFKDKKGIKQIGVLLEDFLNRIKGSNMKKLY